MDETTYTRQTEVLRIIDQLDRVPRISEMVKLMNQRTSLKVDWQLVNADYERLGLKHIRHVMRWPDKLRNADPKNALRVLARYEQWKALYDQWKEQMARATYIAGGQPSLN